MKLKLREVVRRAVFVAAIGGVAAPLLAPTPASAWWGHPGWHAGWHDRGYWHRSWGWHAGWGPYRRPWWHHRCCWGPPVVVVP